MKITKPKLNKTLGASLIDMGYLYFPDGIHGSQGLYVKKVEEYFLTLGLMLSRFYDYKFTADLYISLNTDWNFLGTGVPKKCSERVSLLLFDNEAEIYLDDIDDGIKDDWWHGLSPNRINTFLATVKISEERILTDGQLLKDIQSSGVIKDMTKEVDTVIQNMSDELSDNIDFTVKEIPKKSIGGIPLIWFQHSYQLMYQTRPDTINKLGVKRLALNAWIMSHFK